MAVNTFTMALMPISQAASWYAVLRKPLFPSLFFIALFYCLWAVYNKYFGGSPQELGHISMGILALTAFFRHRKSTMVAVCIVLLNFLLPAYLILIAWGPHKLAIQVKDDASAKGLLWAIIFKLYFVSHIGLWIFVLMRLYHSDENGNGIYQRV